MNTKPADLLLKLATIWGIICLIPLLVFVVKLFLVSVVLGMMSFGVLLLIGWVLWSAIKGRISNPEEDHYDNIEN